MFFKNISPVRKIKTQMHDFSYASHFQKHTFAIKIGTYNAVLCPDDRYRFVRSVDSDQT